MHLVYNCFIDLKNIDTMMTVKEASVSTAIWPIIQRDDGRGRKKLNCGQKEAIKIACNNYFTLIQGPPGMHLIFSRQAWDFHIYQLHVYVYMQELERV